MKNQFLKHGFFENKYLVGAFLLGILLQIIVVIINPIAQIFNVVELTSKQWIYTILISFVPLIIMEIQKKFNEFKFGKRVYIRREEG